MPSRPQFSTDDSVKIVAWWYELKDIHKVHCDTTPRTKALNVSRGSCWAGKSSSMLSTDSRRLAVSRWSGQSDTRRNLWQRMKKTLKRWETWSLIMLECQSIRYQLRQIFQSHQESQAQDPRGPHGGCEHLFGLPGRGWGQESRESREAQGWDMHQNGGQPFQVQTREIQERINLGVKISRPPGLMKP